MKNFSSPQNIKHYPVMLNQVLKACEVDKGGLFIDCTFGSGGYSNAILSFPKTRVIGLDRDSYTQQYADVTKKNIKIETLNLLMVEIGLRIIYLR